MIKSYVIDTNILIQAPYACQCFEENRVILPLVVLEELDGLKKAEGEKGANARRAIRFLEKLRRKGDLLKGVQMGNGGILRVETNCVNVELPESLPEDKPDNRILKVCKGIREEEKPVVLVTKDLVLRLKAQILGIEAQDFSTEQVIEEEGQYSGRQICYVAEDKFKEFKKKGIRLKELYLSDEDGNKIIGGKYNELVNWLKAEIKHSEDNNVDIPTVNGLKRRLHSLESNYVKYSIGGIASSDRDAVKDLAEDAVLSCRSAANNGVGYGANFEGLIASSKCISNSIIDGKTGIELDMYKIIYSAFREVVLTLYKSVLGNGAEEELEASMKIHFQPINLRDLDYKGDVLCSIETDIAILEAISRIETMIFNTTQCLLFRPTDNVYLSDEEIDKMK